MTTETTIDDWRVATIKASKLLNQQQGGYHRIVAREIYEEMLHKWMRIDQHGNTQELSPCGYSQCSNKIDAGNAKALIELCQRASDLALLLRSSKIEYRWEQNREVFKASDANDTPVDHDVIGQFGNIPQEGKEGIEARYWNVFGGVVRGDRTTGAVGYQPDSIVYVASGYTLV